MISHIFLIFGDLSVELVIEFFFQVRMLDTHDLVQMLVPLVENPPWCLNIFFVLSVPPAALFFSFSLLFRVI